MYSVERRREPLDQYGYDYDEDEPLDDYLYEYQLGRFAEARDYRRGDFDTGRRLPIGWLMLFGAGALLLWSISGSPTRPTAAQLGALGHAAADAAIEIAIERLSALRSSPAQPVPKPEDARAAQGESAPEGGAEAQPVQEAQPVVQAASQAESSPITGVGALGHNIVAALEANGGKLMRVELQPGESFSFNESVGNPALLPSLNSFDGVYGGGWCDLAGRYIMAARGVGVKNIEMIQHGGRSLAGLSVADSPYIWNIGGERGNGGQKQDVIITNDTASTLILQAERRGDEYVIVAYLTSPEPAQAATGALQPTRADAETPKGYPVPNNWQITQGWGVGTHAPAQAWGGIDLANGGNTAGTPALAIMSGTAHTYRDTWPGGNCVRVTNEHWETKYCHLNEISVQDGQEVQPGVQIGLVGFTGDVRPRGPGGAHLHFELYHDGANINPAENL